MKVRTPETWGFALGIVFMIYLEFIEVSRFLHADYSAQFNDLKINNFFLARQTLYSALYLLVRITLFIENSAFAFIYFGSMISYGIPHGWSR